MLQNSCRLAQKNQLLAVAIHTLEQLPASSLKTEKRLQVSSLQQRLAEVFLAPEQLPVSSIGTAARQKLFMSNTASSSCS
jgi:hypothetical protein